jgi:hypothetical protein
LGGARLRAEEQTELEGKTLDEIRREIEGLDGSDDDGDEQATGKEMGSEIFSMQSELSSVMMSLRKKMQRMSSGTSHLS